MSFFPSIVIDNPYHIGDNVILEAVCSLLCAPYSRVYLLSDYPEMFTGHPTIVAKPRNWDGVGAGALRGLDIKEALRSVKTADNRQVIIPDKLKRIYEAAGLPIEHAVAPRLYLTDAEKDRASEIRSSFTGPLIGVVLESRYPIKTWPNTNHLIKKLLRSGVNVVGIGKAEVDGQYSYLYEKEYNGLFHLTNESLREVMLRVSVMDLLVGPDTGMMHIGAALNVPTIIVGYGIWSDLYSPYRNCKFVAVDGFRNNLKVVSAWSVHRQVKATLKAKTPPVIVDSRRSGSIAVLQLEGLGGTTGLIDHAEKIHALTGEKPFVVARKYRELFAGNPHIKDVITVGMVQYEECIPKVVSQFKATAVVKTGVGRWFGDIPDVDIPKDKIWGELFDKYPLGTKMLERYRLNFIQTANKSLGLPYEEICTSVVNFHEVDQDLPERFIVVSNGVDTWHKGLRQTKAWVPEHWNALVAGCDLPVVQVGTDYDEKIDGAIDLRGKTTIPQLLTLLRDAAAIVCTEGGLMHLAYAVGNFSAVVLRGPTMGSFFHYQGLTYVDSYLCDKCYWDTENWYKDCPRETDAACMKSITPERVLINLERVLDEDMVQNPQSVSVQLGNGMEQPALCL